MSGDQRPEDLAYAQDLIQLAPQEAQAFLSLKSAAERPDGAILAKYRELICCALK